MKTSVIEVRDMLSVLSVLGVEKRIGKVPGVESVTVNYAAGSATVRYDETRLEIADIKSACAKAGMSLPHPPPLRRATVTKATQHRARRRPQLPAPAAPKTSPGASATAGAASAGTAQQDKAAPGAALQQSRNRPPPRTAAALAPTSAARKITPRTRLPLCRGRQT